MKISLDLMPTHNSLQLVPPEFPVDLNVYFPAFEEVPDSEIEKVLLAILRAKARLGKTIASTIEVIQVRFFAPPLSAIYKDESVPPEPMIILWPQFQFVLATKLGRRKALTEYTTRSARFQSEDVDKMVDQLTRAIRDEIENHLKEHLAVCEQLALAIKEPTSGVSRAAGDEPVILPEEKGGHRYPEDDGTSDCTFNCGAWMGPFQSGGPDPFGKCPKNPLNK